MIENEMQTLVNQFLKDVEKELPDWLKDKKEHKEVLAELEEHVWNKAEELSEGDQPTLDSVEAAIVQMGTPKTIAKEYKRRGTPKVYITEEMWPLYKKVLTAAFVIILVLNILIFVLNIVFWNPELGNAILELISGMINFFFIAFAIISIIFVVLSLEGFIPDDFKSKKELEKGKLEIESEQEFPISEKTGKKLKPFIKPTGEIIGGAIGVIIGVIFIILPFSLTLIDVRFLVLLQLCGILGLIDGIIDIVRGLIGNRKPGLHQLFYVIKLLTKFLNIPILVYAFNHPEIFPIFYYDGGSGTWINGGISPEFYGLYKWIVGFIIVVVCLSAADEIYKIVKLQNYKS